MRGWSISKCSEQLFLLSFTACQNKQTAPATLMDKKFKNCQNKSRKNCRAKLQQAKGFSLFGTTNNNTLPFSALVSKFHLSITQP